MNEQGTSIVETAAIFNIPAPATISQWQKVLEDTRYRRPLIKEKGASIDEKRRKEENNQ